MATEKLSIGELRGMQVFRALPKRMGALVEAYLTNGGNKVAAILSAYPSCSEKSARVMAHSYFSKPRILEVLAVANGQDPDRAKFLAALDRAINSRKTPSREIETLKLFAETHGYGMSKVENENEPSPAQGTAARPQSTVAQPHVEKFYEEQTRIMMNNITALIAEGRSLRLEANGLIVWCRHNNVDGGGVPPWGEHQKAYATDARLKMRERAAKLKADIQFEGRDVEKILNIIFDAKFRTYPYTEADELQARKDLGI